MKHTQALVAIFIVGSIVAVTISSIMNRATTPPKSYEECAVVEEEFYYPEDDYWQSLTADISNNQIWYASNDGEIIEPNPDALDF